MDPNMFPVFIGGVVIILTLIMILPSWVKGGIFSLMVVALVIDSLIGAVRAFLR
jgi:hypothetical protein